MNQEYIDLVDEKNNLTGEQEKRSVIHSKGLWHRTIHIYFFRKVDDRIDFLVHLRSKKKDLHPNCWDTRFGGHIQSGQNIEAGAIDEIKEETDLDIEGTDLIDGGWRKTDSYPNNEFNRVYYFEFKGNTNDLKFNDGEVQKVKWMFLDDIIKSMKDEPSIWAGDSEEFKRTIKSLQGILNIE